MLLLSNFFCHFIEISDFDETMSKDVSEVVEFA